MSEILPSDFQSLLAEAVKLFWRTKQDEASEKQGGTRGSVLGGKHLDGFLEIFKRVAKHCGVPDEAIVTHGHKPTLAGYFRATKNWDALIFYKGHLIAALELKSQVGSFGNNQNNRIEEVVGLGTDFWAAGKHGVLRYGNRVDEWRHSLLDSPGQEPKDPRPPFVGYLMLLEDTPRSHAPMEPSTGTFKVHEAFKGASYADRYRIMAERLMADRLFSSVGVMVSDRDFGRAAGRHAALSEATSATGLFQALAGHLVGRVQPWDDPA